VKQTHFNKVGDTKINHHNESHVFVQKEKKRKKEEKNKKRT
jgi:hypothetical protein